MIIGVMAGTPVDTKMGADILSAEGIQSVQYALSKNPAEQTKMQLYSQKELEDLVREKILELKKMDSKILFIYCNSLSTAVNYKKLSVEENIEIITPLESYVKYAKDYKNTALIAANSQSALGIEKVLKLSNPNNKAIILSYMTLVEEIEKRKTPEEIFSNSGLEKYLKFLEIQEIGEYAVDALILGCTHLSYLKEVIRKNINIQVLDPGEEMISRIKEILEPQ